MKKICFSFLIALTIGLTQLSACSLLLKDEEKFIQGTWRTAGELDKTHAWFLEWTFDNGKFKQIGYPPLAQEGKYRVVKTEESKLTIELYDQKGTFGTENKQIVIVIDKEKNKLKIDGKEGFTRTQKQ